MKLKKKSLAGFDPGTSRSLEMYFTTALFYKLKYSDEIKIYNESILIQGKTTHFLNKNSGLLKLKFMLISVYSQRTKLSCHTVS